MKAQMLSPIRLELQKIASIRLV